MKVLRGIALAALGLFALKNLVRGGVHVFAADGGAGIVADLDLSASGGVIVSLFAAIGAMQMVVGVFEVFVLARRRDLLTIALGLQAGMSVAGVLMLQVWKPLPVSESIAMFNLSLAVLAVAGFIAAKRATRETRLPEVRA